MNDVINPTLCSMSLASVDDASLSKGVLLAKFDIANAHQVHLENRLLGISWHGEIRVDGALLFHFRSTLKLFTTITDALLWDSGKDAVVHTLHFLDNFFLLGIPAGPLTLCVRLV